MKQKMVPHARKLTLLALGAMLAACGGGGGEGGSNSGGRFQTIDFKYPGGGMLMDGPVTLSAVATSGLAVSFQSSTPDFCTVSGTQLTLVKAGECRVVASQRGEPILNLIASFQTLQPGLEHQDAVMPDVPPPESLRPDVDIRREVAEQLPEGLFRTMLLRPRPIDFRSVEPRDWLDPKQRPATSHVWFRTVSQLPDYRPIHRAVLAYASDFQLLATAIQPHGRSLHLGQMKAASLDHAVWYHDDFRADEWLLYVTESPWTANSRGFGRGQIFSRDGRLVASVAQEGMLRAT